MCIGTPMQVVRSESGKAICTDGANQSWVDMSLIGDQPSGSWVLVFLESAREVLEPERAAQITDALNAVSAVMKGESTDLDSLFADLLEREPQLPEHLQSK